MNPILVPIILLGFAGTPAAEAPDQQAKGSRSRLVVATVNGEPVYLSDLERRLGKIHGQATEQQRGGFDLDSLLFKMTNDILLGQEARALEMHLEPPTDHQMLLFRKDLLLKTLDQQEVMERSSPGEEEVAERYEEQYRRITFRVITQYEQDEAVEILELLEGGADMPQLARERSVDPYALREGLVQRIARIDLQRDIAEVAFTLEPGQLAGPIRTDLGWSVIRVESFEPADPERYDVLKKEVFYLLQYEKATRLRSALAQAAKDNHPVVIDQDVLDTIRPKRLPDTRLVPDYPDPDAVVARIGEHRTVTAEQFGKALLTRWSGVRNEAAARAATPIILQKTIEEKLLLAEAEDRGYADLPMFKHLVRQKETDLLVPRYLEEFVAPLVKISPEELKAYYDENKDQFHKPPRVRIGQITVATEKEANTLAEQLRNGADLAWLAKQHTTDRFKEQGGDRGWVTVRPGVDSSQDQLMTAPRGTVLDPVGTEGNWQVLMVTGREEQGIFSYEEISGNIRQRVFQEKLQVVLDNFINKLRERAEIKIDDDVLAGLGITGSVQEGGEEEEGHSHAH